MLYRIHWKDKHPLWFGIAAEPDSRFDDPEREYGVCYTAEEPFGAFVETFFRDLPTRFVSMRQLEARSLATLRATRELRLVQAYGPGLVQLGTTAAIAAAAAPAIGLRRLDYTHAQAWSRALYTHPEVPDGIAYHASHDDSQLCAAIFDRAQGAVRHVESQVVVELRGFVAEVCVRYRILLLD